MNPPTVTPCPDAAYLARLAAERFTAAAEAAVRARGRFVVALSGGITPRGLYDLLASAPFKDRIPWQQCFVAFADERCVPPDHEDSNYQQVHHRLLRMVPLPSEQVLRMEGEDKEPSNAAALYEFDLGELFPDDPIPRFDLVILGVGVDGHTASLYPGTTAIEEQERWVAENHVPSLDAWRITLTLPVLNAARQVLFLVSGKDKAKVVKEAFGNAPHPEPYPCERVRPGDGSVEVLVDAEASAWSFTTP